MKDLQQTIANTFLGLGFYVADIDSKTKFGESLYVYVSTDDEFANVCKIRISDHEVTNMHRMYNEIHVGTSVNIHSLKSQVLFRLQRSEYFEQKEVQVKTLADNVQTFEPWESDVITGEKITKSGKRMFFVTRTYNNTELKWFNKLTGKIYG